MSKDKKPKLEQWQIDFLMYLTEDRIDEAAAISRLENSTDTFTGEEVRKELGLEKSKVTEGVKYDQGKERLDLIPPEAIMALGEVLSYGANKYEDRNWEKGFDWGRAYGALQRHLTQWWAGEELDEESGLCHLHHAITNVAFLIAFRQRKLGKDTRK